MLRYWLNTTQLFKARCFIILVHFTICITGYSDDSAVSDLRYWRHVPSAQQAQQEQRQQQQPYSPLFVNSPHSISYDKSKENQDDINSAAQPEGLSEQLSQKRSTSAAALFEEGIIPPISDADDLFLAVRQRKSNNLRNMMRIGKRGWVSRYADDDNAGTSPQKRYSRTLARILMYPKGITLFRA